ncbi:MAG: hypothetical protein IPI30_04060 [Saprospiraceae bacterium]|nr:hypothetical protein [Candidatus Vicinibacter affinis]
MQKFRSFSLALNIGFLQTGTKPNVPTGSPPKKPSLVDAYIVKGGTA